MSPAPKRYLPRGRVSMFLVLVCGSRDWKDRDIIRARLEKLPGGTVIMHGECRGADMIADSVASELGFDLIRVPAMWEAYGRSAGPRRNRLMLDLKPNLVLAFHEDIHRSKGTIDTVREARRRGIKTEWGMIDDTDSMS